METFLRQITNIASGSQTDDIFIVGKGRTIDQIETDLLASGIVININDSEKVVRGNICLFHKPWVITSLKESGFGCNLYVTDVAADDIPSDRLSLVPYMSQSQERNELLAYRLLEPGFVLEETLFASAVKIANLIGEKRDKLQDVYMLGFDFQLEENIYSEKIQKDFSEDDFEFKRSFILNQEFSIIELFHLIEEKKMKHVNLIHVGYKPYSSLNPTQFNLRLRHRSFHSSSGSQPFPVKQDKSDKDQITDTERNSADKQVLIVAEFTNNHLGDIDRLKFMVRLAAQAGADLIKVQKRNVDSFYSQDELRSYYYSPFGKTFGDYRKGVELTEEGMLALEDECFKNGVYWFSSVLDYESYLFLKRFNKPLIKIPSTISEYKRMHDMIAKDYTGPIVVSTGLTTPDYEDHILTTFGGNERIYLMQTSSAYPTPPYDCQIAVVRHYRLLSETHPKLVPAYSSHDVGPLGSMLSVAAGARMIEKHVKLGNTEWIHFDHVALDLGTSEFSDFVRNVRLVEKMCGHESKVTSPSEHHKYFHGSR